MLTHRYRADTGYDNPTVFCADQMRLIVHMEKYVAAHTRERAAC